MDLDPTYHPTIRERILQGVLASQREQEQIARRRRIARKHRRNEWAKKHETGIALFICLVMLVLALVDWPWL